MFRRPPRSPLFPSTPLFGSYFGEPFAVAPVPLASGEEPPHEPVRELTGRIERALADDTLQAEQARSEEHTSELQSRLHLVCRLLLEKKKSQNTDKRGNCRTI